MPVLKSHYLAGWVSGREVVDYLFNTCKKILDSVSCNVALLLPKTPSMGLHLATFFNIAQVSVFPALSRRQFIAYKLSRHV